MVKAVEAAGRAVSTVEVKVVAEDEARVMGAAARVAVSMVEDHWAQVTLAAAVAIVKGAATKEGVAEEEMDLATVEEAVTAPARVASMAGV